MAPGEEPRLSEPEQTIVRALHAAAAAERAPAQLREQLERQRLERERLERDRGRTRPARGLGAVGVRAWSAVGAVVIAAATAAALLIPGGGPGAPSIAAAAALAARGSTLTAPGPDPTANYLLNARVENLHFPNWQAQNRGWVAVGARTDQLGNRDVTTVYYQRGRQTIAYSIVSSPELAPAGLKTFMQHGRTVFAWRESGHTCLLSGKGVSGAVLKQLAGATARSAT